MNDNETVWINAEALKPTTIEDLGYVQVVRCKDCKKRKTDECMMYWNEIKDDETWDDDWFCADGERKEGR